MEYFRNAKVYVINKEYPAIILGKEVCERAGVVEGDRMDIYHNNGDIVLRKRRDAVGTIAEMCVPVMEGEGK